MFHLYVPKRYRASESRPLVVVGHGGNAAMSAERAAETAERYVEPWIAVAEKPGFTRRRRPGDGARLFPHGRRVDLERSVTVTVTVTVNGEGRSRRPKQSLETLLDLAREFDDRGRVFEAASDVEIGTSRDAPDRRS